jgi:hypothetical protein
MDPGALRAAGQLRQDRLEPPEGPHVPLRPGFLGDLQDLRRLGAAELLEVSQRDHLSVQGLELVERLLDVQHLLGPDRSV